MDQEGTKGTSQRRTSDKRDQRQANGTDIIHFCPHDEVKKLIGDKQTRLLFLRKQDYWFPFFTQWGCACNDLRYLFSRCFRFCQTGGLMYEIKRINRRTGETKNKVSNGEVEPSAVTFILKLTNKM